jgi:hypothetical protein
MAAPGAAGRWEGRHWVMVAYAISANNNVETNERRSGACRGRGGAREGDPRVPQV